MPYLIFIKYICTGLRECHALVPFCQCKYKCVCNTENNYSRYSMFIHILKMCHNETWGFHIVCKQFQTLKCWLMAFIQNLWALWSQGWEFHDIKNPYSSSDVLPQCTSQRLYTADSVGGYLLGSQRPDDSTATELSGCSHTISEWHLGDQFLPFSQSGVNRAN